ncbi:MAG: single-stranded DNA-binding protein [Weeksellaceae bacterium]|jgi:single-strand DNA-binding protein|nr:single-stranded DNA-binding protein [Weeksellaceae bacterium]MDX9704864.1 single-stranded DNA-binding protein [Weeksellaceae bacterium]
MNGTLNKVILIGNVGGEIKIHQFDNHDKIGRFSLATSESYTRENGERIVQTEWHNVVVRNKVVDIFEKYVKKGDKLYIEGKLKSRKWQDANGQDRYTTEIIVSDFTFLTPKNSSQDSSSTSNPEQNGEDETPF